MRYHLIRETDIANGEGIGVALFVQGCHFKCKNCFNPETHDFNGGKAWTPEVEDKFIELASKPYIKRISLLGGECLADENLDGVLNLVNKIRLLMPQKTIWIYSGYEWEHIFDDSYHYHPLSAEKLLTWRSKRQQILKLCNIFVDGRYIDSQRNIQLMWRGSENQRVIDIQESLKQNKVILYCD